MTDQETINKIDKIAEFETPLWKEKMSECGEIIQSKNIRQITFVHGTFAGEDPIGLFGIMKSFGLSINISKLLKKYCKTFIDKQMSDLGNFPEDYISSFTTAINLDLETKIDCRLIKWSSENNHIGRLKEVPNLTKDLAENIDKIKNLKNNTRILLIGHSHAGQLFALLTVFLEDTEKAKSLLVILNELKNFDRQKFSIDLQKIATIQLDFVTLGTPVRYPWGNQDTYNLLHIVNHRSPSEFDGVLTTRDGDYVQQWGTNGTDLTPLSETTANKKLDVLLDKGVSNFPDVFKLIGKLFTKQAESKRRTPIKVNKETAGETLFFNYEDNKDENQDDPLATLFGHGAYTLKENMLFTTHTIIEHFYK